MQTHTHTNTCAHIHTHTHTTPPAQATWTWRSSLGCSLALGCGCPKTRYACLALSFAGWALAVKKRGAPALPYPLPVGLRLSKNEVRPPCLSRAGWIQPCRAICCPPACKGQVCAATQQLQTEGLWGGLCPEQPLTGCSPAAPHQLCPSPTTSSAPHQQPALPLTNNQLPLTSSAPAPASPSGGGGVR